MCSNANYNDMDLSSNERSKMRLKSCKSNLRPESLDNFYASQHYSFRRGEAAEKIPQCNHCSTRHRKDHVRIAEPCLRCYEMKMMKDVIPEEEEEDAEKEEDISIPCQDKEAEAMRAEIRQRLEARRMEAERLEAEQAEADREELVAALSEMMEQKLNDSIELCSFELSFKIINDSIEHLGEKTCLEHIKKGATIIADQVADVLDETANGSESTIEEVKQVIAEVVAENIITPGPLLQEIKQELLCGDSPAEESPNEESPNEEDSPGEEEEPEEALGPMVCRPIRCNEEMEEIDAIEAPEGLYCDMVSMREEEDFLPCLDNVPMGYRAPGFIEAIDDIEAPEDLYCEMPPMRGEVMTPVSPYCKFPQPQSSDYDDDNDDGEEEAFMEAIYAAEQEAKMMLEAELAAGNLCDFEGIDEADQIDEEEECEFEGLPDIPMDIFGGHAELYDEIPCDKKAVSVLIAYLYAPDEVDSMLDFNNYYDRKLKDVITFNVMEAYRNSPQLFKMDARDPNFCMQTLESYVVGKVLDDLEERRYDQGVNQRRALGFPVYGPRNYSLGDLYGPIPLEWEAHVRSEEDWEDSRQRSMMRKEKMRKKRTPAPEQVEVKAAPVCTASAPAPSTASQLAGPKTGAKKKKQGQGKKKQTSEPTKGKCYDSRFATPQKKVKMPKSAQEEKIERLIQSRKEFSKATRGMGCVTANKPQKKKAAKAKINSTVQKAQTEAKQPKKVEKPKSIRGGHRKDADETKLPKAKEPSQKFISKHSTLQSIQPQSSKNQSTIGQRSLTGKKPRDQHSTTSKAGNVSNKYSKMATNTSQQSASIRPNQSIASGVVKSIRGGKQGLSQSASASAKPQSASGSATVGLCNLNRSALPQCTTTANEKPIGIRKPQFTRPSGPQQEEQRPAENKSAVVGQTPAPTRTLQAPKSYGGNTSGIRYSGGNDPQQHLSQMKPPTDYRITQSSMVGNKATSPDCIPCENRRTSGLRPPQVRVGQYTANGESFQSSVQSRIPNCRG